MSIRFHPLPLDVPELLGIRLSGSAGRDAPPLLERLAERCLEKQRTRVVLDLGDLAGVAAGAAAGLAELQRRLVAAGGEAVFVAVGGGVRHFLGPSFTGLPLRCSATVPEAVATLLGQATPTTAGDVASETAPAETAAGSPLDEPPPAERIPRFLSLEEAVARLRAGAEPATAGAILESLLRTHGIAAATTCWLRRGEDLVDAGGRAFPAGGVLASTLREAARPLTLLDVAGADLSPAETELLADAQPDLLLPLLRDGRLEGMAFLRRPSQEPELGVSENFALDLLVRVLSGAGPATEADQAPRIPASPAAGGPAADGPEAGWHQELAVHIIHLLHATRLGGQGWAMRVADLVAGTARELRLPAGKEQDLVAGALLCDLALLGEPQLDPAAGKFGPSQWERYRAHPAIGADLLAGMGAPESVVAVVRHHHERYNGEGYPGALAGRDIPLEARIVAVVETWVAMTTDLPSRPALPPERALVILAENVAERHDPEVVQALLKVLKAAEAAVPA